MTALAIAGILLVAYFLGSIPFGLVIGRSRGIDIREHGSGNIGATNVWRVLGKKWGLLTFVCDMVKGLVAVVFARWIVVSLFPHAFTDRSYAGIAAAIGCILGHSFPPWLGFKGGKGVATSLGVIFGMMPFAAVLTFATWGVVFKATRYVSLASIVASIALPVIVLGLMFVRGPLGVEGWGNFYFACAAALLVVRRHRDNIKRLVAGTENRFGAKADADESEESA